MRIWERLRAVLRWAGEHPILAVIFAICAYALHRWFDDLFAKAFFDQFNTWLLQRFSDLIGSEWPMRLVELFSQTQTALLALAASAALVWIGRKTVAGFEQQSAISVAEVTPVSQAEIRAAPKPLSRAELIERPALPPVTAAVVPAAPQRPPGAIDPLTMRPYVKDPYPEGPILTRRFCQKQANTMIDAVQQLRKVALKAQALAPPQELFSPMHNVSRTRMANWKEKIESDGYDATIATLLAFKRQVMAVSSQLEQVLQEEALAHFAQDLIRIRGDTGLGPLMGNLDAYVHRLEILKKESPDGAVNIRLLDLALYPTVSDWHRVYADFHKWRSSFVNDRAIEAERQLQQFL
jgi:hypothetical protein